MTDTKDRCTATLATRGRVLHSALGYDLLAWLLLVGKERAFRERLVGLARLEHGESVLDVGCGTGSLAIVAKQRVGPPGTVWGLDASPELLGRARKKARKKRVDVGFTEGIVEALPFADGRFDTVLSTLMLHHLPRDTRVQCVREIRRVLKPAGRVLAVDFGKPRGGRTGVIARFHRHGGIDLRDLVALLDQAGLTAIESGSAGVRNVNFILATAP